MYKFRTKVAGYLLAFVHPAIPDPRLMASGLPLWTPDTATETVVSCWWKPLPLDFPGGSRWLRVCEQCRGPGFDPWVRKIPWRREWQPIPVFSSEEFHEQKIQPMRSHRVGNPCDHIELDMTEWLTLLSFTIFKVSLSDVKPILILNYVQKAFLSIIPWLSLTFFF